MGENPPKKSEFEKNTIQISSKIGINYSENLDRKFLEIPIDIIRKIGKDNFRKKVFPDIFDGSWYAWAEEQENYFKVELPPNITQEQTQRLINKIEQEYSERNV